MSFAVYVFSQLRRAKKKKNDEYFSIAASTTAATEPSSLFSFLSDMDFRPHDYYEVAMSWEKSKESCRG